MPDICMCRDRECPMRESCYRYRAVPTEWRQSYFANCVRGPYVDGCSYYMGIWPQSTRRLRTMEEIEGEHGKQ